MIIQLNQGDVIYTGKFKNRKTTVKEFGVDDKGQPLINGKKVLTFRVEKFMNKVKKSENIMKKSELKQLIKEVIKEGYPDDYDFKGSDISKLMAKSPYWNKVGKHFIKAFTYLPYVTKKAFNELMPDYIDGAEISKLFDQLEK